MQLKFEKSLTPSKSGKKKTELGSNEKTPPPEPLTIEKLNTMSGSYKKGEKLTVEDRLTLSLYGYKIDGRKNIDAIDKLREITTQILTVGQKLNDDISKTMALPRETELSKSLAAAGGGGASKKVNTKRGTNVGGWGTAGWRK